MGNYGYGLHDRDVEQEVLRDIITFCCKKIKRIYKQNKKFINTPNWYNGTKEILSIAKAISGFCICDRVSEDVKKIISESLKIEYELSSEFKNKKERVKHLKKFEKEFFVKER